MFHLRLLTLGFIVFQAMTLCAGRLRVDFNQRSSGDFPVYTQEDFDPFVLNTSPQTTPVSWKIGLVTLTISNDFGNGLEDRRRTVLTNSATFTNAQILQDFIFNQGATTTNSGMTIRIQGLHSNQVHQIRIWCYDSNSSGSRVSDWYANGILVKDNYSFNGSVRPASNTDGGFSFDAMSDANGELLIRGRRDATSIDQTGAAATAVFLNALEIESIPDQGPPCNTLLHFQPGSNLYGWTGGNTFEEQNREVAALKEAGAQWVRINVVCHAV